MGRSAAGADGPQDQANSATTASSWPAGATILRSIRPWPTTATAAASATCSNSHDLQCHAISAHLVGQAVCDIIDERHKSDPAAARLGRRQARRRQQAGRRGAEEHGPGRQAVRRRRRQRLHRQLSIWHLLYSFPPVPGKMIDDGFKLFADRFNPILDVFAECGVQVRPGSASDRDRLRHLHRRAGPRRPRPPPGVRLQLRPQPPALAGRRFGRVHPGLPRPHLPRPRQGRDRHAQRPTGILASHLNFGDPAAAGISAAPAAARVNFEEIIRELNRIGYQGPLSVEWEDSGMDREFGAREACGFVKQKDFAASGRAFDAAFEKS